MENKRVFWFTLVLLLFTLGVGSVRGTDRAKKVKVWVTTDDQSKKLERQPTITFSEGCGVGENTIFVDEFQRYQTIEGFGASFTDSAAYLLNQKIPPSQLKSVMNSLFHRKHGIAIGFVRNPMGASDLARFIYSYQDSNGTTEPPNFSIAHDMADIVPLVRMAKQINPELKIMASPWSPPGWMKTSGSMIGGALLPDAYGAFADYFVKFIKAYAAEGIPIDYISLQNEPLYVPGDYPGMFMDPETQVVVLRDYVLPALSANNIDTKVLVYDHNWDRSDYPDTVLSDPVLQSSAQIAGIAWHGYGGTPGAMTTLRNKYPDKGNYQTEHSGGTWISNQVNADFEEITQVMRNWGKAYVKWGLALDENRGPHTGGCGTCTPLVTVNSSTGEVKYEIDYFTLGHFSKFILPGAYRIYSSNAEGFVSAAFKNPDGSNVLVVYNDTLDSRTVHVVWGDRSFTYDFQGLSGATFTWEGRQDDGYSVKATAQSIQASSYNETSGIQTEVTSDANGGYNLGYIDDGDWALYKNIDFGSGVRSVQVRVASAGNGGTLEFRLNGTSGPLIGSVAIPITGGWQTWTTVSTTIARVRGTNDLYIVFRGTSDIGNVNWFKFSRGAGTPDPIEHPGLTKLLWSDEFNGSAIDTANWNFDLGNSGWGNNELQNYTNRPENARIENGRLVIEALQENLGGSAYTSARLHTAGHQEFGINTWIEARIQVPQGQGIWPAFWTLGSSFGTVGWPACGEIDIMEMRGQNPFINLGTMHWANANGAYAGYGAAYTSPVSLAAGFHTFAIHRTATAIKWYVDGIQYHEGNIANGINSTQEFQGPFFIIVNVAVGGNFVGSPNASTVFPQRMLVDYIRVWGQ
jgi:O-glycosyl hydrolase/beta-glucanase (GH16 family)